MRKKGVPGGGRYVLSLESHGAQSLDFASTKYSYTVSFAGVRLSCSFTNASNLSRDASSRLAPTDHTRQYTNVSSSIEA